jgi:molybdenum cofactor guanylyltransferase
MRSAIILCGGRSRRMGQDKGLMSLDNEPLIIHIIETLEELVEEILVVLRDENQLKTYKKHMDNYKNQHPNGKSEIKLINDLEKDKGPLMGILSGLLQVKGSGAIVLPCDSPFISHSFVNKIFNSSQENKENKFRAVIPKWPDGSLEPLHAYYFKTCIPSIQNRLLEGFLDVKSILKIINVNYVDVDFLDPEKISFKNLNRPEDVYSNGKK